MLNESEWAETAIPLLTLDIVLFSIKKFEEFWDISTPPPLPLPSITLSFIVTSLAPCTTVTPEGNLSAGELTKGCFGNRAGSSGCGGGGVV